MANKSHDIVDLSTKLSETIASEPSRHTLEHDEWLLDEALAETFPASDSIAVSSSRQLHSNLPLLETGGFGEIPDCKVDGGSGLDPSSSDIPIECDHCHTTIPETVAVSFEGSDYIYHFCGPQCVEAWCTKANLL